MMAASAKMFLGFSDITSLHIPLNRRGLPTVHAPMGITLVRPRQEWVYESLRSVLRGGDPIPANSQTGQTVVAGRAEGIVTGGCLILLCDSLGTPNEVVFDDRIVIIEDVDEAPHRVDGMLTHLLNHGGIRRTAGIVMGEMSGTDDRVDAGIGGMNWREIVRERLSGLGIPFIIDFPFGHAANMLSLPLGIRAELNADAGTLRYLEPLCQS
jgi:muramoyltetrapeptide carboxypeptidase